MCDIRSYKLKSRSPQNNCSDEVASITPNELAIWQATEHWKGQARMQVELLDSERFNVSLMSKQLFGFTPFI